MKNVHSVLLSSIMALLLSCFSLCAHAQAPVKVSNGILTNGAGMTLYVFDLDPLGRSDCNGPCAANWPPLLAQDGDKATGDYTIVTREDGKKQWALKGKPLYTWSKDQKPGDKTGDGFKKIWHVAKP